jgi:uncharacterized protein
MKVVVSEIPDEGLDLELDERIPFQSLGAAAPVKARLRLSRSGLDVLVRGETSGAITLQCGRCLKEFVHTVESSLDSVYHPAETLKREDHYELTRDELDAGFYRGDTLDIDEVVSEQLLLNIPMKPLCGADCRGICPVCGADLNEGDCSCGAGRKDSPFDSLKELLKRKE